MAKPNYTHAKRQKEALRKARQVARLQRRQSRRTDDPVSLVDVAAPGVGDAADPKA